MEEKKMKPAKEILGGIIEDTGTTTYSEEAFDSISRAFARKLDDEIMADLRESLLLEKDLSELKDI